MTFYIRTIENPFTSCLLVNVMWLKVAFKTKGNATLEYVLANTVLNVACYQSVWEPHFRNHESNIRPSDLQVSYSPWYFVCTDNIYTTTPLIRTRCLAPLIRNIEFLGLNFWTWNRLSSHTALFVVLLRLFRRRQKPAAYFESMTLRIRRTNFPSKYCASANRQPFLQTETFLKAPRVRSCYAICKTTWRPAASLKWQPFVWEKRQKYFMLWDLENAVSACVCNFFFGSVK
jgi:hypothetical protein